MFCLTIVKNCLLLKKKKELKGTAIVSVTLTRKVDRPHVPLILPTPVPIKTGKL